MPNPITTGKNGMFQPGNQAAKGHSTRSQKLRGAILQAITKEDVQAITAKLVEQARSGDHSAAKLLLGFIGKGDGGGPTIAIQNNVATQTTSARELAAKIRERLQAQRGDDGATPD